MKQKQIEYPKYNPGQVLTDKDLNSSFNYLDEQNRLSRLAIGSGIIEGLTLTFSKESDTITIQKGKAVTPDGSLIILAKPVQFSLTSLLSQYRIPRNSDFQIYLKETFVSEDDIYGDLRSGDIKSTINRSILSLVLDRSLQPYTTQYLYMQEPNLSAPYNVPASVLWSLDLKELRLSMKANFFTCRDVLVKGIEDIVSLLKRYPQKVRNYFCNEKYLVNLEIVAKEFARMGHKKTEIPQHYLFFCQDLKQAIVEYVNAYNKFVKTYDFPVNPKGIEGAVALGSWNDHSVTSCYRMTFRSGREVDERRVDKTNLDKLLYRMVMMIRSFNRNHCYENRNGKLIYPEQSDLCLIPTQSDGLLNNRALPSYYRSRMLHRWWYCTGRRGENFSSFYEYGYNRGLSSDDLSAYNSLRLDGPYQIYIDKAFNLLNQYVEKNGLPITIKKAKLYKRSHAYRTLNAQNICDKLGKMSGAEYRSVLQKLNVVSFPHADISKSDEKEKLVKKFIRTTHNNYFCLGYGEPQTSPFKDLEYISRLVENFPTDAKLSDVVEFGKTLVLLYYNKKVIVTVVCSDYDDYWK